MGFSNRVRLFEWLFMKRDSANPPRRRLERKG
jgi:hypothetical protein